MASVTHEKRKLANGEFRHKATIHTKKDGGIIHRESKTFTKKELNDLRQSRRLIR